MKDPKKFIALITELKSKSDSKLIMWEESSAGNSYYTMLANGSIVIDRYINQIDNGKDDNYIFQVTMYNPKGETIDDLCYKFDKDKEGYFLINDLFNIVTKNDFDTDKVFEKIFDEISGNNKITSISSIFDGIWNNTYFLNNRIGEEFFEIKNKSKYFINNIHIFNIEDFSWDENKKLLTFVKVRPNGNSRTKNVLTKINEFYYKGFENDGIPVFYGKVLI